MSEIIRLPRRTLLVLAGPAGCGKSTFAARRFAPTEIVSSDACRGLICDDPANQQVNRDAFDLFYSIINKRLYHGRFTVADSTALKPEPRLHLLEHARSKGYLACLLVFKIHEELCRARNNERERRVEDSVIPYHEQLLKQALLVIPSEGWHQVYYLNEQNMDSTVINVGSPA